MRKVIIVSAVLLAALAAGAALAQGPGGGGQSAQFREQHKYTFQLMQMVHHIAIIDKDPKHTLSAAQAKKTLAVLKPLRTKPKLTEDQAKQALKGLKKVFTVDQLNAMAKIKPGSGQRRTGPGGPGGPGGGGRPGGPGGPPGGGQGNRPRFDANAMKDFNPFYAKPSKSDARAADRGKRWNEFFTALEKKASGKATAKPPAKAPAKAPAKPAAKPAAKKGK